MENCRNRPFRATAIFLAVCAFAFTLAAGPQAPQPTGPPPKPDGPQETPWPYTVTTPQGSISIYQPQPDSWDGHVLSGRAAIAVTLAGSNNAAYGIIQFTTTTWIDRDTRLVTLDHFQIVKADFPAAPQLTETWLPVLQKDYEAKSKTISLDRLEASLATVKVFQKGNALPLRHDPPRILFSSTKAILVSVDGAPVFVPVKGTKLGRVVNARALILKDGKNNLYLHLFDGWMTSTALEGPWKVAKKPPQELNKALQQAVASKQVDLLTCQASADTPPPSLAKGAPVVYVSQSPTELIVTDGEPQWTAVPGTQLAYVQNTTGNVFRNQAEQKTYVLISGRWFSAANMSGPWAYVPGGALPADFLNIPDDSPKENVKASVPGTPQAREALIAASIPQTAAVKIAEVKMPPVNYDGAPVIKPIEGTTLRYVANAPYPVIVVDASTCYAVQNAVWFVAPTPNGPWKVATSVPAAIYAIPPSSPLHYVTYVRIYDATPDVVYVGYTPGYYGTYIDHSAGVVVYGTGYEYIPWVGEVWYGPPVTYGGGAAVTYTPWAGWAYGYGYGWYWGGSTVVVGWGWGAYPWWGPWGWYYPWYAPLPVYPYYGGIAFGPYGGVAAWGPGWWAASSGNVYHRWGDTAAVTRTSAGFNAWTGNEWAKQSGIAYNSRTGVLAAGQRGAVENVYTGNYAEGARGVATNTRTGTTAAGRKWTVGNENTGKEISGGKGVVYNPNTGNATTISGIKGEDGGVVRKGDDVYAGKDGNVYRRTDDGWQKYNDGNWSSVDRSSERAQALEQDRATRRQGETRTNSFQNFSNNARTFQNRPRPTMRRR